MVIFDLTAHGVIVEICRLARNILRDKKLLPLLQRPKRSVKTRELFAKQMLALNWW